MSTTTRPGVGIANYRCGDYPYPWERTDAAYTGTICKIMIKANRSLRIATVDDVDSLTDIRVSVRENTVTRELLIANRH